MPNTFTLIASSTVGASGTSSINFTSIPSTYTDLCIQYSLRTDEATTDNWTKLTFNSVGGTSNNALFVRGNGTTVVSSTGTNDAYMRGVITNGATSTSSTFASTTVYIPNYTSSNNKSASIDGAMENNATYNYMPLTATLLNNTSVISSIQLTTSAGNFVQYSTAYLYGIVKS